MMWRLPYWSFRLLHPRKFRDQQEYIAALDAWLAGTATQPNIHDYL
jgi:hypothetical protein